MRFFPQRVTVVTLAALLAMAAGATSAQGLAESEANLNRLETQYEDLLIQLETLRQQLEDERERVADIRERELAAQEAAEQEAVAQAAVQEAEEVAAAAAEPSTPDFLDTIDTSRAPRYDTRPDASDIAQLGRNLTAVGAIRAGNADGTIPAWDGGVAPPTSYRQGQHHTDPYETDEILFTIDASNADQYSQHLTAGHRALLEKYPTYKMHVYPTRRSASFPERVYEMTKRNAATGQLTTDAEGVLNTAEGIPFPIPQNGAHVIWNHKMKFKGIASYRYNNSVAPTVGGAYTPIKVREELFFPYAREGSTVEELNNVLAYSYQKIESPARLAGNGLMVHETMNSSDKLRQAWIYNPGQRRVRRAPNVGYDNPGLGSDGLRTNDMRDMFNGAMDRYNWYLRGRKELYVPYNSYKAHRGGLSYEDVVRPNHAEPDLFRYELHRVWVVEAYLKDGKRHINPRRTFYVDEDSWQILAIDHYNADQDIWRVSEAHPINYYDLPVMWSTMEVHHDLRSGRYLAEGLDNNEEIWNFGADFSESNFTPAALRKKARR